jgi:hypothetical protein
MESNEAVLDKNEVVMKYVQDGFVAADPIQTPSKKRLQKRLLLKIDIILVGLISLIMLVNQWVSGRNIIIRRSVSLTT